jgi:hypothetical protein
MARIPKKKLKNNFVGLTNKVINSLEIINEKLEEMEVNSEIEKKRKLFWKRLMTFIKISTLIGVIYLSLRLGNIDNTIRLVIELGGIFS